MADRFKLYCEYIHCRGIQVLELGFADTEEEALKWREQQTRDARRPRLPENDLVLTCAVQHCPIKLQIPRYSYSICRDCSQ